MYVQTARKAWLANLIVAQLTLQ